tara:strand:+ start:844 stop:1335 length:492 start_codon:yes stop_codon:yes gene_type:complete
MEELDTDHLDNYREREKQFIEQANLTKESLSKINVWNLYINKRHHLEKIKINELPIETITDKASITNYIKSKCTDETIKYKLLSVLKYNIELEKDQVQDYMNEEYHPNYLEALRSLENIEFKDGLNIFEDLHTLFILYYEKSSFNVTKRVRFKANNKTRKDLE